MLFFFLLYLKEAPGCLISLLCSHEKLQKTYLTLTSLFTLLLYKCLNKDPKYFHLYLTQAQPLHFRVYLVIYFFLYFKDKNCLFVNPLLQAVGFLIIDTSESSTLRQILFYLVWSSHALGKPAKTNSFLSGDKPYQILNEKILLSSFVEIAAFSIGKYFCL